MKDKYWIIGLVAAIFIAGFISLYASPEPDGLERVAEDHGFLEKGEGQEVFESPMPDYILPGIENEQLAASVAGIIGTLIIFGLVLGVGTALKKKPTKDAKT
jgi:cobalt/nickel transport protein